MAKLTKRPKDSEFAFCPFCSGWQFWETDYDDEEDYDRTVQCEDQFKKGCHWSGSRDELVCLEG